MLCFQRLPAKQVGEGLPYVNNREREELGVLQELQRLPELSKVIARSSLSADGCRGTRR